MLVLRMVVTEIAAVAVARAACYCARSRADPTYTGTLRLRSESDTLSPTLIPKLAPSYPPTDERAWIASTTTSALHSTTQ